MARPPPRKRTDKNFIFFSLLQLSVLRDGDGCYDEDGLIGVLSSNLTERRTSLYAFNSGKRGSLPRIVGHWECFSSM